jgi:hypothetical protein
MRSHGERRAIGRIKDLGTSAKGMGMKAASGDSITRRRSDAVATVEVVEHAVTILLNDRQTFARFRKAVNESVAVSQTHFPRVVARWYSQSVLVGLRRLGDRNPRTHSLMVLMDRMLQYPADWNRNAIEELWTRDRQHDPFVLEVALESTYGPFADSTGRDLNTDRVTLDRETLTFSLSQVRAVVDKSVAHTEREADPTPSMTFAQLDEAIDSCHELVKPYIALLTGRGYSDMTPVEQYNWWRIFTPWQDVRPFGGAP